MKEHDLKERISRLGVSERSIPPLVEKKSGRKYTQQAFNKLVGNPRASSRLMHYILEVFDDLERSKGIASRNTQDGPETKGLVPVISWVQAGEWCEAETPYLADEEEFIPCPKTHSIQAYALRVQGDSMTAPVGRSYPEGSIIYVDPETIGSVSPGDRVIAKLKGNSSVTFKQLASDGSRMYLKALNPNHPPIFDEFRVIGKIIGMWVDD